MARAVVTLAVDVDYGQEAEYLRRDLVAYANTRDGVHVRESSVAVDQTLATEDVDE